MQHNLRRPCSPCRPFRPFTALLTLLLALPAAAPAATPPGAESPQKLVERMNAAAQAGDFGEIAACLAPADRAEMAVGMVAATGMMVAFMQMGGDMAAGMAEGMAEGLSGEELPPEKKAELEKGRKEAAEKAAGLEKRYEAILDKHGLKKKLEAEGPVVQQGEDAAKAAQKLLEGVDDVALLRDLMALLEDVGDGQEKESPVQVPREVTGYKIEGDRATAKSDDEVIEFVKVDGRWYFSPAKKGE